MDHRAPLIPVDKRQSRSSGATSETLIDPGTQLGGRYEVLDRIGSGGMGEVYRAVDTRLDRIVAVKVLRADSADPSTWRIRFEREARAVSNLNHPHICALYDLGQHEGAPFLVMEYLDGETLGKRLARGSLPFDQVLRHGIDVCSALAHAHHAGFVHRDVKPSNIMLTSTGAKLLDFGIAKRQCRQQDGNFEGLTAGLGATLTLEGAVVGTVQYMAPEQLEGFEADPRTDVFAVGLMLYEMATGRAAFAGRTAASVIARVLTSDPSPLELENLSVSHSFDWTVKRCLAKPREERWQSLEDLKSQLVWILETISTQQAGRPLAPVKPPRLGDRFAGWAAAGVLGCALMVASAALWWQKAGHAPQRGSIPARFFVGPPTGHTFLNFGITSALSPDGRYLAFVATSAAGGSALWLRPLTETTARQLPDTDGAVAPFWSPDSRYVAFFTRGQLKKIEVAGARSELVGDAPPGLFGAGTWSSRGIILMSAPDTGLFQLSAADGQTVPLTKVDQDKLDRGHSNPRFLPDGRQFIFLLRSNDAERAGIYLTSVDAPQAWTRLLKLQLQAEYVDPGYLVFVRDRNLWAQPFDARRGQLTGDPTLLAERVALNSVTGRAGFTASQNGVLAYHAIGSPELVWVNRTGRQTGLLDVHDFDANPAISPSGASVAFAAIDTDTQKRSLWINEIRMDRLGRVTDNPRANNDAPVWSPDGRRLAFASDRNGPFDLYMKSLDTGDEELLFSSAEDKWPLDWSADGQHLLFQRGGDFRQLWGLPMSGARTPVLLERSTPSVAVAHLSPDGRWLAYVATESGRNEIFVRSFPANRLKIQVSDGGGTEPVWVADGRELVYLSRHGTLMTAPVTTTGSGIEIGTPVRLFDTRLVGSPSNGTLARNHYTATPDGQRFLINQPREHPSSTPMTVVVNWNAGR